MTQTSTSHRVKEVIVDVLELDVSAAELRESEPLYSALIRLDSLTLLQLITELEGVFGCQIDDEAVMLAELVDVASIVSLVKAQLADRLGRGGTGAPAA
jgi:acyl carrier protein